MLNFKMMVIFYETYCTYQWEATLGNKPSSCPAHYRFRETNLRHEDCARQVSQSPAMGSRQPSREDPRMQEARPERGILPLALQESLCASHGARTHDPAFQQNAKSDL